MQSKRCTGCKKVKPLSKFHKMSASRDGYKWQCKECRNANRRTHYANNCERTKARNRTWRKNNQKKVKALNQVYYRINHRKIKARSKMWRENNPDKKKANDQAWVQSNREKVRIRKRAWRRNNPGKEHEKKRRRRAHKLHAPGNGFTEIEFAILCEKYDNKCLACGRDAPLTRDHVIPLTKNGPDSIDNIQPLCRKCNSSKGTKETDYRKGDEYNGLPAT